MRQSSYFARQNHLYRDSFSHAYGYAAAELLLNKVVRFSVKVVLPIIIQVTCPETYFRQFHNPTPFKTEKKSDKGSCLVG